MRLVADECCPADVIAALREAGHDVLAVVETSPGLDDRGVVALANEQRRILVTEDLDFGEIAIRHALVSTAVVLLRIANVDRAMKASRLCRLLETTGDRILGHCVVVETGRFRFRPLATSGT